MSETLSSEAAPYEGATVVITHRVRNDKHADYEIWLDEIAPICNHLITTFAVTGVVVCLMVYVVMPRYTKLIQRWLFS